MPSGTAGCSSSTTPPCGCSTTPRRTSAVGQAHASSGSSSTTPVTHGGRALRTRGGHQGGTAARTDHAGPAALLRMALVASASRRRRSPRFRRDRRPHQRRAQYPVAGQTTARESEGRYGGGRDQLVPPTVVMLSEAMGASGGWNSRKDLHSGHPPRAHSSSTRRSTRCTRCCPDSAVTLLKTPTCTESS